MTKDVEHYLARHYFGHEDPPIETLDDPLIIEVAPTGSFLTRDINPHQPYTPTEVADNVVAACEAGASICHLHVRDEAGLPDQSPGTIVETVELIREAADPILTLNTLSNLGGADYGVPLLEETVGELIAEYGEGHLDMITTPTESLVTDPDAPFVINEAILADWVGWCYDHGLRPELQLISYNGTVNVERWLVDAGVLEPPYYMNYVSGPHGFYKSGPTTPYHAAADYLQTLKTAHPIDADHLVLGAQIGGRNWFPLTVTAILQGYDLVRVGMEDATYRHPHRDEKLTGCGEAVEAVRTVCAALGREVATPAEARERLGV